MSTLPLSLADIPRRIWFHWAQGIDAMPQIAKGCLESWKRHNPEWKIIVIDRKNVGNWVDQDQLPIDALLGTSEQVYANAIRLALLRKHGGVWADATSWCRMPLSAWLTHCPGDFFAFSNPASDRVMDNWFIASLPDSYIIQTMEREYVRIFLEHGPLKRFSMPVMREIMERGGGPDIFFEPFMFEKLKAYPYFLFHYLFGALCHRDPAFNASWAQCRKISAEPSLEPWRIGLAKPINNAIRQRWKTMNLPIYKLSWRSGDVFAPDSIAAEILAGRL